MYNNTLVVYACMIETCRGKGVILHMNARFQLRHAAGIYWLLDMEHLGHCRRNIGDVNLTARTAVLHLPAIEQQGDMGVVGIPLAVGGADGRRR